MHGKPFSRWLSIALLLLIGTIFGSNHIAARIAFDHGVNITTAVVVRSAGTVLIVWMLLAASRVSLALPAATRWRSIPIGLLICVQSYCIYSAVAIIPVALALLAFNFHPMALLLISWAAGGERPPARALVAMPVALFGLAIALGVIGGGADFAGRWQEIGAGVAWALGAAVTFASALVLTGRWLTHVDGRVRTLLTMSTVGVVMLAAGLIAGNLVLPTQGLGWLGLVLLTLFYGVAFTAMFVVLPRLDSLSSVTALNFEPIAVLFLAWPILGQSVEPLQILGAIIVVGAIIAIGTGKH